MAKSTWGPRRKFTPDGARRRWVRRGVWTAALAALVATLAWLAAGPFLHPRTHLVLLTGDIVTVDAAPEAIPADFVAEDFRSLLALEPVLHRIGSGTPHALLLGSLRDPEARSELADRLHALGCRSRDVLLIYVAAHGIVQDGDAWLLPPGAQRQAPAEGRFRLAHLLAQLRECEAPLKIVLLEAGRIDYDAPRGLLDNDFPEQLAEQVQQLDDPGLFVLCSHSAGQRSHLAPALRRTVFGHFVTLGLSGAADQNGNRTITLDELARYVVHQVSDYVRQTTGGASQQRPFLVRGGGMAPLGGNYPLVVVSRAAASRAAPPGETPAAAAGEAATEQAREKLSDDARRVLDERIASSLARVTPRGAWASQVSTKVRQQISNTIATKVPLVAKATGPVPAATGADAGHPARTDPAAEVTSKAAAGEAKTAGAALAGPAGQSPLAPPGDSSAPAGAAVAAKPPPGTPPLAPAGVDTSQPPDELLAQAWQLRDRLLDFEGARPLDYAPLHWAAMEAELLALDRHYRTGFLRTPGEMSRPLSELVATFEQLAELGGPAELPLGDRAAQIADLRPGRLLPPQAAHSLALLELAQRLGGPPLSSELAAAAGQLDQLIAGGNRPDLERLAAALPAGHERYSELRLARWLASMPSLDWRLVQLLLATGRLSEQAAAARLDASHWAQAALIEPDALRADVESRLHSPASLNAETAITALARAREQYHTILANLQQITAAERALHDVLRRLPSWLAWHAKSGGNRDGFAPDENDLRRLLDEMAQLAAALRVPRADRLNETLALAARLEASRARVERSLDPAAIARLTDSPPAPDSARRMLRLLETPLPRWESRALMLAALPTIDAELAANWKPQPIDATDSPLNQPLAERLFPPRAELEHRLAAAVLAPTDTPDWRTVDSAWQRLASPSAEESLASAEQLFAVALQELYRNLPARAQRAVAEVADLSAEGERERRLERLRAWDQAQRLIPPRFIGETAASPQPALATAAVYDLLLWQRGRADRAAEDAPPAQAAWLRAAADQYQRAAAALPWQPRVRANLSRELALSGPAEVSLAYAREAEVGLQIHFTGPAATSAWMTLEFDPESIALESPALRVYSQRELLTAAAAASDEALRSRLTTLRASTMVVPGRPVDFRLALRRLAPSNTSTYLVVRAFTAQRVARHDIAIMMPPPEGLQIAVRGIAGTWGTALGATTLHPFPNRTTSFALELASSRAAQRVVDVQLFALQSPLERPLPHVSLVPELGQRLRQTLALSAPLAEAKGVALPADGSRTPLFLEEPKPPAAPAASAPAGAPTGGAAPPPAPPEADKKAPPLLAHGLILAITDTHDQSQVFRHFEIAPPRPQRFLKPRVRYDLGQERIEIEVAPLDPAMLPPDGVRLSADVHEPLPSDAERQLAAVLVPGQGASRMFVEVPAEAGRVVTLYLHVDDFPRAFIYRVPCSSDLPDVPPAADWLAVRIANLPHGTVYRPPLTTIPVDLEIDAPPAAPGGDALIVDVGIDRNRDRDLVGDVSVRLTTDRQATAAWAGLDKQGQFLIATTVTDQRVHVPAAAVISSRANIIARAAVGDQVAWSAPREIVIDDQPPRLAGIELRPSRSVTVGADVEVSALGDDRDLSGIARVEAMFDLARSGQFGPDAKPVLAALRGDGRWAAKLPTAGLGSGNYNILLRAVDRAGNEGPVIRTSIRLQSAEEAAAAAQAASRADITGVVVYGDVPQANIEVQLVKGDAPPAQPDSKSKTKAAPAALAKATTDAQGQFRFASVPAGAYRVIATGLVRNKNRTTEQPVAFQSAKDLQPLKLELP